MNVNLDDKRIMKIIYQLEDGSVVAYSFKNGELWTMQALSDYYERKDVNETPTDREMIERIRTSEFMNELEGARKRFKLSKEIADTFPDKEIDGTMKPQDRKYSEESLKVAQEIIKMDKEGKLDEIAAVKRGLIDKPLKTAVKEDNNDLSYESDICANSIRKIENKALIALRNGNKEELEKLMDNYKFYNERKKTIDNKIWNDAYRISLDE